MSRHTQLARKVRQVTPATYHPPRRVRPDIRNLTEPQPHRHPASAFDTRRMQRHTQRAESRAQSFPIQGIRQVTHAQTYTTRRKAQNNCRICRHPAAHACQDTHNTTLTAYTGCQAPTSDTPTAATPTGMVSNNRRPIRPYCRRIISAYSSRASRTRRSSQTRPRLPPDTFTSTPAR